MHLKPPHDMKVIKKEEKEAHLFAFIAADLERRQVRVDDDNKGSHSYLLIARSMESPVVRALASLGPSLAKAGVSLRTIISTIDTPATSASMPEQLSNISSSDARLVSDHRLFDAHEQLILSDNRVWIGDIMRREPAKRDAFENYVDNCEKTANWAKVAFERLWAVAKPLPAFSVTPEELVGDETDLAPFATTIEKVLDKAVSVGTRH